MKSSQPRAEEQAPTPEEQPAPATKPDLPVKKYVFVHDGQDVTLPLALGAASDEDILRTLATWVPLAGSATLLRSTPDKQGTVTLRLELRARPKGLTLVAHHVGNRLKDAPAGKNPIISLYEMLSENPPADSPFNQLRTTASINKAIAAGEAAEKELRDITKRLRMAAPIEAPIAPLNWS